MATKKCLNLDNKELKALKFILESWEEEWRKEYLSAGLPLATNAMKHWETIWNKLQKVK
jgi:hypothetical protein